MQLARPPAKRGPRGPPLPCSVPVSPQGSPGPPPSPLPKRSSAIHGLTLCLPGGPNGGTPALRTAPVPAVRVLRTRPQPARPPLRRGSPLRSNRARREPHCPCRVPWSHPPTPQAVCLARRLPSRVCKPRVASSGRSLSLSVRPTRPPPAPAARCRSPLARKRPQLAPCRPVQ